MSTMKLHKLSEGFQTFLRKKWAFERAASHRGLYVTKRIFSSNTASKAHGRRQPCRGLFLCLAEKFLALECVAVLNRRFLFAGVPGGRCNTGCIARMPGASAGEKIHSKPYKSLCESAQTWSFLRLFYSFLFMNKN